MYFTHRAGIDSWIGFMEQLHRLFIHYSAKGLGSWGHFIRAVGHSFLPKIYSDGIWCWWWGFLFTACGPSLDLAKTDRQLQVYKASLLMWPTWKGRDLSTWLRLALQSHLWPGLSQMGHTCGKHFADVPLKYPLQCPACLLWQSCLSATWLPSRLVYLPRASVC